MHPVDVQDGFDSVAQPIATREMPDFANLQQQVNHNELNQQPCFNDSAHSSPFDKDVDPRCNPGANQDRCIQISSDLLTQQSFPNSGQTLVMRVAESAHRRTDQSLASTSTAAALVQDSRELALFESEPLSIPDLCSSLQDAVRKTDVPEIAKLQRRLVLHTTVMRKDAKSMTATYQNLFDHVVPLGMRGAVDRELEPDFHTARFTNHASIVKQQRDSDKTLAFRQAKVLDTFKDHKGFLEVAVKYGWFEKKFRFWQHFTKLVYAHSDWPGLLKTLRKQFFNTHCEKNDWVALAKKPVHDYFTSKDIEDLANTGIDPGLLDPVDHEALCEHFSLVFDVHDFLDPVRCGQVMFDTITKDLRDWRQEHCGQDVPRFSDRLKITVTKFARAVTVTADSAGDKHLEGHVADPSGKDRTIQSDNTRAETEQVSPRRSVGDIVPITITDNRKTTLSNNNAAMNARPVVVTPRKFKRGAKQQAPGRPKKRAKNTNPTASDQEELQTSANEGEESGDNEDQTGEEEQNRFKSANSHSSKATGAFNFLEYMSKLEKKNYNDNCRKVAALFEKTLQFVDSWIEQAHNFQGSNEEFKQLEQHLDSFENAKPLISKDGYRLATEWKVQGLLTREVFDQASDARASADVWSLTNTQACELMNLGVPIEKPISVRPKEHSFSLPDFLCHMEHKYSLDGELSVQGGTADNPQELVSSMRIREVVQRLEAEPDPQHPLMFKPLNCLDLAAFQPYTGVPAAMQHRRFSVVSAMQSRISRKAKNVAKPGKQRTARDGPAKTSSRAADMEFCAAFMLLASKLAFSLWHEDLLNNTWVQCLSGKKAWFMRVDDSEDTPAVVILEPGDWLLMPAGLQVEHAVLTLDGPSVMTGGQHLDGHFLIRQLHQITKLIEHPDFTNEPVPALQLPAVIDEIIEYLDENPEDSRIFIIAGNADNPSCLANGLKAWRDMSRDRFRCKCASDGKSKCVPGQCPCLSKAHEDNHMTRRCTSWCAGKRHTDIRDVDKPGSCFYDQTC